MLLFIELYQKATVLGLIMRVEAIVLVDFAPYCTNISVKLIIIIIIVFLL